ncbi:MAG: efflux RND transporter permease subunit [Candidatus Schekmanbacteria bacterium]|nr:MAG: efflux RND transporter permease subunit [Candidatus Schekmanbacteria bacterium]
MKKAIEWMAKNHVAANLLMLLLIVGGLINAFSIKQEIFPEMTLDMIQISMSYPGAGPEEIEEGIILKIEENISGIAGIKEVRSTAMEGIGIIDAELEEGEDPDIILQDIKSAVDRITTFPENAEKPVISKLVSRNQVVSIVLYGDTTEWILREQADIIQKELLALPEITQVDLVGVRPYEISVEIPEENLRRYNLTLNQVAARLKRASLDLPAGTVKTAEGNILLRTKEKRYWAKEYEDISIITNIDGTEVKLKDIAKVKDTFSETDTFSICDGKPAVMIKVSRVGDQKPTVISDAVKRYIKKKKETLPSSLNLIIWNDSSENLASRLSLLKKNAFFGLCLVLLVLGMFLEIRLAMWVMLGIPISVFGGLFILPFLGVSINMISLFAFILVLGILVDDAIVIGENIYAHRQMGKTHLRAAIDGAIEVAVPVIFSVLTTVAAFVPLLFVGGIMGKFIKVIPMIVITLLLVSLIESLFILPSHLSGESNKRKEGILLSASHKILSFFSTKLTNFISGPYRKFLKVCLNNRYNTIAVSIFVLIAVIGMVQGGILKFVFMPEVDSNVILIALEMSPGTPLSETAKVQKIIAEKAREAAAEYDKERGKNKSIIKHIYSVIGGKMSSRGISAEASGSNSHIADIAIHLEDVEERGIPAEEIGRKIRSKIPNIAGVEALTFDTSLAHFGGANIDIQLSHDNPEVLEMASEKVKQALAKYPGVGSIVDTFVRGKDELKIRIKPEARTLGITEEEMARQIRAAFYGAEALRFQRGRNEVKVMVKYPPEERKRLANLEAMRIRIPGNTEIPLLQAAYVEKGKGFNEINRTNRKRVVNVSANVYSKVSNAQEIIEDLSRTLLPDLARSYPGLSYSLEGQEKERRESFGSMIKGFPLALIAIFALLAIPFKSYIQPLLIMVSIPYGIIGAFIGHLIMGFSLNMLSIYGLVALAGVVVNDSLLLIDKINRNRYEGQKLMDAVVNAAERRFRPILLTSLTTFFGLIPILLESSVQAQWLIPMAISLAFGVLFATSITLILIPSLYVALEDIHTTVKVDSSYSTEEEITH